MTRPLAPADVPAWAWSELRQLPDIRAERDLLIGWRDALESDRASARARKRRSKNLRARLREITTDIIRREGRLLSLGIDPVKGIRTEAVRPFSETER